MPDTRNILQAILQGLATGAQSYPGFQAQSQNRAMDIASLMRQLQGQEFSRGMEQQRFGLQQKEFDANEMYRQKMLEAQAQQREMQFKQDMMARLFPPQPKPMHPLEEQELQAKIAKTQKETSLLGKDKEKKLSISPSNKDFLGRGLGYSMGMPMGQPNFHGANSIEDFMEWYNNAGKDVPNRDQILMQAKQFFGIQ